jgi:hypothetical protein
VEEIKGDKEKDKEKTPTTFPPTIFPNQIAEKSGHPSHLAL